ncbi:MULTISPECIES: porin [unclassified Massilia]|uniref:porin n=1 Tax=unclassified Massilia TaxID=2609279 RepID=UPI001B83AC8F|nr:MULTISPECIES: porin [unclassified Massilia]MBQ5942324.1 porin [Massilia sp. AB1]MBQ5964901.1 porin [Massilia sp. ZL223]
MKYQCLAAAVLSCLPLFAHAQSNVQVYGVMDAAIAIEDTDAPGEDRRTVINSGNQSSSRLGFRGTEDLGNGLKALFNIEAGVALDTGAADSTLFGRRAVVGLQGNFGTVTVGREYSPIAAVAAATDILGQGMFGSNLSAFGSNRLTRRLANSVNYKSNALSGFVVNAAYSTGEKSVDPSGDLMGVSVEYKTGGLYLGGGYHVFERLASGDDKEWAAGAGYAFGPVEIKGNYLVADPEGANNEYKNANLGASYAMGPSKFFLNFQQQKLETGAKGKTVSLAYTYALSKRTNIYTTYAQLRNNGRGVFGINSSSTSVAPPSTALGADPSVFSLGLRHTF